MSDYEDSGPESDANSSVEAYPEILEGKGAAIETNTVETFW